MFLISNGCGCNVFCVEGSVGEVWLQLRLCSKSAAYFIDFAILAIVWGLCGWSIVGPSTPYQATTQATPSPSPTSPWCPFESGTWHRACLPYPSLQPASGGVPTTHPLRCLADDLRTSCPDVATIWICCLKALKAASRQEGRAIPF